MGRLKNIRDDDEGILSVMDALIFALSLMLVTLFLLQMYSTSLSRTQDIANINIEQEAAINIQNTVIVHNIRETGYEDLSSGEFHTYRNITVERAIKNYLYLKKKDATPVYDYNLTTLNNSIKEVYMQTAVYISHYHFVVRADYEDSTFFISDVLDGPDELDAVGDMSVATYVTTLADAEGDLRRMRIQLYIWI